MKNKKEQTKHLISLELLTSLAGGGIIVTNNFVIAIFVVSNQPKTK